MSEQLFDIPWPTDKELPRRTTDCMPDYSAIPEEFKRFNNSWVRWQQEWFFDGLKEIPTPLDGIDIQAGMRHLNHIQRSMDIPHEYKECAVAFLASKWFQNVEKAAAVDAAYADSVEASERGHAEQE